MKSTAYLGLLVAALRAFSLDLAFRELDAFYGDYVCNGGVHYQGLLEDGRIAAIDKQFQSVTREEFDKQPEKDRLAFLINAYNFYTIVI